MKHIKYTYVNGYIQPEIKGLGFGFALESQYPTLAPTFYGTCDADADLEVEGFLAEVTPQEYADAQSQEVSARREMLLELMVGHRWRVMTGGIVVPPGLRIATDEVSYNRVTSVIAGYQDAGLADESEVDFKAETGYVKITIAQVKQIAGAMGLHMQACFSAEAQHAAAIELLDSFEAIRGYDFTNGWPSND